MVKQQIQVENFGFAYSCKGKIQQVGLWNRSCIREEGPTLEKVRQAAKLFNDKVAEPIPRGHLQDDSSITLSWLEKPCQNMERARHFDVCWKFTNTGGWEHPSGRAGTPQRTKNTHSPRHCWQMSTGAGVNCAVQ